MSLLSHYVHGDDARIVYGYKCRYKWIDLEFVTQLIHRSVVIIIIIFFWPRYSIPEERKNYAMQYEKVQKSSWNEPYSSSSFTKQSCSKMALYRWIKTGIYITGIYIAQVRKGHECVMSARWQYGYVDLTVYISMYHIHKV